MKKYVINNVNSNDFDKILSKYISQHNMKFDLYFIKCKFDVKFINNFTQCIETNYLYKLDTNNIKIYSLHFIE